MTQTLYLLLRQSDVIILLIRINKYLKLYTVFMELHLSQKYLYSFIFLAKSVGKIQHKLQMLDIFQ